MLFSIGNVANSEATVKFSVLNHISLTHCVNIDTPNCFTSLRGTQSVSRGTYLNLRKYVSVWNCFTWNIIEFSEIITRKHVSVSRGTFIHQKLLNIFTVYPIN